MNIWTTPDDFDSEHAGSSGNVNGKVTRNDTARLVHHRFHRWIIAVASKAQTPS